MDLINRVNMHRLDLNTTTNATTNTTYDWMVGMLIDYELISISIVIRK